ncbi:MAG TPA: riboflavin synthase [Solirubrobacterales bacterium]|nr:riboflavin synthase [Solirubrobacterales bacterium]
MFTGIVRELGRVESLERSDEGARIRVKAELANELGEGDSVSVNGACLTATSVRDGAFEADVMHQTLSLTTLGELEGGSPVNLELALRPTDRLGGHVVQGHVDGTATVEEVVPDGFAKRLKLRVPDELRTYVVERGSIAIEGVSLTVAELDDGVMEVSLIPETLERTTLGEVGAGDRLNVECDVLGRYVHRQLSLSEDAADAEPSSNNPFN